MYGEDSRDPGTYAANCLLGRKLLEKDVKFVQLYHQGWDQHLNCPGGVMGNAKKTDQANAALIKDLKQRGMFEDTLGAGVKPGISYGETDDFSYNVIKDPVHTHDFQATLLHLFGIDHEQLIYKHQGRRFRLTDVHGHVVKDILS